MARSGSTADEGPTASRSARSWFWGREIGVVLVALGIYFGGRAVVEGSPERSTANAERLLDLEASLGLDIEADLQALVIDNEVIRNLGNLSYVWLHWPLLIAALIFLAGRDRRRYRHLRDTLFASGALGLVLFTVFPMSPPRFMPGFVGTVSDDARRHHLDYPIEWANQYAAFPSFHVGWTLVACLAVAATLSRRRWRLGALVPAVLVGVAVITTGNHYVLDSVAGAAIAVGAYVGVGSMLQRSTPTPGGADQAGRRRTAIPDAAPGEALAPS